jgi:hypothetical protein
MIRRLSGPATMVKPPTWLRGPGRVEGGWVTLDPKRAEEYEIGSGDSVLWDLLGIRHPSEAIGFVSKHGLLFHGPQDKEPGTEELRERFADWERGISYLKSTVAVYHVLRGAVRGDPHSIEILRNYFKEDFPSADGPVQNVIALAITWVADSLSAGTLGGEGCRGVEVGFTPAAAGHGQTPEQRWAVADMFQLQVHPPNLWALAHFELGTAISKHESLVMCAEEDCGRYFPATDRRQLYCSDRCANRARHRRWWAKKKRGDTDDRTGRR